MRDRPRFSVRVAITTVSLLATALAPGSIASAAPNGANAGPLGHFKNIVVIYEENHSFDNLYGLWGSVNSESVVGLPEADAAHTTQVAWDGHAYTCLLQKDVNLIAPAVSNTCATESVTLDDGSVVTYESAFPNAPFNIDQYIPANATTCPPETNLFGFPNGILNGSGVGSVGGCTRDLVHRFYQEQYQLNGGQQNRYVTGSDATATSMGYYDTTLLPIYAYLHANGAPNYVIADHFFQGAFGGSFLNHQFLIAAAAPVVDPADYPVVGGRTHAVLSTDGFPTNNYTLYKATPPPADGPLTQECGLATTISTLACGDYGVNTLLPWYQPTGSFSPKIHPIDDTTTPMNIGDELSNANVSWAYYGGGWDNAAGITNGRGWTNGPGPTVCTDSHSAPASADGDGLNAGWPYCPDRSFQQHHYPFAYFLRYAPGTPDRAAHLQDEADFLYAAQNGGLPSVSFVKPVGRENEHPGYASEPNGSDHLVDLIQAVETGPQAGNTLIVVTYDEFGGQWDHVPPPGLGTTGASDLFGPGTRIPALLIGRSLTTSTVDHTVYDTTSILATIELEFGLSPLSATTRDGRVNDLGPAISAGRRGH
jgi:acid phosphatase